MPNAFSSRLTASRAAVVLLTAICFGLAACGDTAAPPDEAQPAQPAPGEPSTTDAEAAAGEPEPEADGSADPSEADVEPAPEPTTAVDPASPLGKDLAAVEKLRQDAQFAEATRAARALEETYADDPAAVAIIRARQEQLRRDRREQTDLTYALKQLGSANPGDVRIAARQFEQAGPIAPILLRKVVRDGEERPAVEAATILGKLGDSAAVEPILQRFLKTQRGPQRTRLAATLDRLAADLPQFDARRLYRMTLPDPDYHQRDFVQLLGAYVQRALTGNAEAFNKAVGDDEGYAKLSQYVEQAYLKGDDELRACALSQAERFDVVLPGLLGRYYIGSNFDTFAFERLDSDLELLTPEDFGFPDKRGEYFSVRWTGKLLVQQPGEYAIRYSSDDGHRLFINGDKLIDHWDQGAHYERVIVKLEPGLHDIVVEHQQTTGECYAKLSWRGPGIKGEPNLDDRCLRFAPRAEPAAGTTPPAGAEADSSNDADS